MRSRGVARRVVLGGRLALTHENEGVDFQRRSRIPLPWSRPAGGVGGCVRNIGRGEPRSPIEFSLQCDARPNTGRTDAALAPVWSWIRPADQPWNERKLEIEKDRKSPRDTDHMVVEWVVGLRKGCASDISEKPILLGKKIKGVKESIESRGNFDRNSEKIYLESS